jgi:hypothetical protein
MINNSKRNVSLYPNDLPNSVVQGGDRKIQGGPIYPVQEVLELAQSESIQFWSRGAIRDQRKWSLDVEYAGRLVCEALRQGRYKDSEWCEQKPHGPWTACDSYVVKRAEWIEQTGRYMELTWYVKFAISKAGTCLLMISNHPEGT